MRNRTIAFGLLGLVSLGLSLSRLEALPEMADEPETPSPTDSWSPDGVPGVASAPVAGDSRETWVKGQVLLSVRDGLSLDVVAARHGSLVVRPAGPSGYGAILVPADQDDASFAESLLTDPEVLDAARIGRVHGAGRGSARSPRSLQWHLDAVDAPSERDLSGIVIALVDSGVAYEDYEIYVQAPSLSSVPFVSPYDFVNEDTHANDDNQHGTHLASIIASDGEVRGVARGVSIMPLKVLDSENQGDELDLIDAISWAIDHDADIINLSLAFTPGYIASRALQDAIASAHDEGILIVAAAGNDGLGLVTQPAANPLVIAVGASAPIDRHDYARASYSNHGPRIDVMAPGGDLTADLNRDGFADGILGESISPSDPSEIGYWLVAGTSQAAAITSGAAAHLLAKGAAPDEVAFLLQGSADPDGFISDDLPAFIEGNGAGQVDIREARRDVRRFDLPESGYHVSILPWLSRDDSGHIAPYASFSVLDDAGQNVEGARVIGTLFANAPLAFSCVIEDGVCTVYGPGVDEATDGAIGVWAFEVEAVVVDDYAFRPGFALGIGPCLKDVVAALEADPATAGSIIGFWWGDQLVDGIGETAEAIVLYNAGTGVATSPLTVILTPPVYSLGSFSSAEVAVIPEEGSACELSSILTQGGGIATSPLTLLPTLSAIPGTLGGGGIATSPLTLLPYLLGVPGTLSGGGIATSPLTFIPVLPGLSTTLSGTGIATSPLTLVPILPGAGFATFSGSGLATSPLTFASILPILPLTGLTEGAVLMSDDVDPLGANRNAGVELDGSAIAARLLAGGWLADEGSSAANIIFGANATPSSDLALEATGHGALPE